MEVVVLKDSSPAAYTIFFQLMYGQTDTLTQCQDSKLLFQVYGLAEKYLVVEEIMNPVQQQIADLEVAEDKLISALETVVEYKQLEGFQEVAEGLMTKVVAKVKDAHEDPTTFYEHHMDDNPNEVCALMKAVVARCNSCRQLKEKCLDGQLIPEGTRLHVGLTCKKENCNAIVCISIKPSNKRNSKGKRKMNVVVAEVDGIEHGMAKRSYLGAGVKYACKN